MELVEVQGYKNIKGHESLVGLTEGDMVEIKIKRGGEEILALEYEPGEGKVVKEGHIYFEVSEG